MDVGELVINHRLQQRSLAWEMDVERFLAHAQFLRQIVHRHAAETVREKMLPRSRDDAPGGC